MRARGEVLGGMMDEGVTVHRVGATAERMLQAGGITVANALTNSVGTPAMRDAF